jgi:hypothetical protein
MKPSHLAEFLAKCIPAKIPVGVKGAPGIGKSDIVRQACEACDVDLIIEHPSVADPTDYKGLPYANEGLAEFLPFGSLRKIINADKPTVYFLDDLGQANSSVQAALMQLILARRINGHTVSQHVSFVMATNRHTDRCGVTGILEAVKSRWNSIVELTVDHNDFILWLLNNNMPMPLIQFCRFRPELIFDFKPTNEIKNGPCPRTIANLGALMNLNLSPYLEREAYEGAVGEGFTSELMGFLKVYRTLPNIDMILLKPETALIPEDPATLYAVCGVVAERSDENNMERVVKYADRLPKEFGVLLITNAAKKHEEVTGTRAYIEWQCANKEYMT